MLNINANYILKVTPPDASCFQLKRRVFMTFHNVFLAFGMVACLTVSGSSLGQQRKSPILYASCSCSCGNVGNDTSQSVTIATPVGGVSKCGSLNGSQCTIRGANGDLVSRNLTGCFGQYTEDKVASNLGIRPPTATQSTPPKPTTGASGGIKPN
jgi:hypothetical protein